MPEQLDQGEAAADPLHQALMHFGEQQRATTDFEETSLDIPLSVKKLGPDRCYHTFCVRFW